MERLLDEGRMRRSGNPADAGSGNKPLRSLLAGIKKRRALNRSLEVLRRLSNRELSDIGLSRADIERIAADTLFRDATLRDRW